MTGYSNTWHWSNYANSRFFSSFAGLTYFSGIELWSLKTSEVIYARNMPKPIFFSLFDIFQTMVKYRRDNCLTHEVVFTLMHLKW